MIVGLVAIAVGIWGVAFRKRHARSYVEFQHTVFGRRADKETDVRASELVALIAGTVLAVAGIASVAAALLAK